MQAPEFVTLGFATDNPTKLVTQAIATGGVRGLQQVPGFDLIGAYTDSSGARLAITRRKGRELQAFPALASAETHRAAVYRVTDQLAHASLFLDDEETLELIVAVDDPTQYPMRTPREPNSFTVIQALGLGAIGVRADVYADEEDFQRRRPDDDHPWSSQTMASPSIAAEGITDPGQLSPRAFVGFTVETAWKRKNELTGKEFWYGTGISAVRLAFALPAEVEVQPGNVVLGTFALTGTSGLWDRV